MGLPDTYMDFVRLSLDMPLSKFGLNHYEYLKYFKKPVGWDRMEWMKNIVTIRVRGVFILQKEILNLSVKLWNRKPLKVSEV